MLASLRIHRPPGPPLPEQICKGTSFPKSGAMDCPSWPGLLLNHQFLLARLRRAFLQDSATPGGSLTLRSPGANFLHASGVQTSSPEGLRGH
jgi:hypothetical protein